MLRWLGRLFITLTLATMVWTACAETGGEGRSPRVRLATGLGEIVIELYPEKAPVTVANFLRYVDEERLEGATFYRVVRMDNQPDNDVKIEVIQGGLGFGDHPARLPPIAHETTAATGLRHQDGTVSMARLEPGTATAEFFICVGDQPELDHGGRRNPDGHGFAAFGRVVVGMDVVRAIHRRPADGQMLTEPVAILEVERVAFTLRFRDVSTHRALRLTAEMLGISMNELAERAIQHELAIVGAELEEKLLRATELLRSYRGEGIDRAVEAFVRAEVEHEDPLTSHGVYDGREAPSELRKEDGDRGDRLPRAPGARVRAHEGHPVSALRPDQVAGDRLRLLAGAPLQL